MSRKQNVLTASDGEELDGFSEIDGFVLDTFGTPAKPTARCKRCGCWLRTGGVAGRATEVTRAKPREYCSACELRILRTSRQCGRCGKSFFSEDRSAIRCPDCEEKYQKAKRVCQTCGEEFLPYVCVACKNHQEIRDICHACHWREVHAAEAEIRERTCRICGCRFVPGTCVVPECRAKLSDICSVCHEELAHDGMRATVWMLPGCAKCEAVVIALKRLHRRVTILNLEKLVSGEAPNIEALAQLAMANGKAPLVFLERHFLEPAEINTILGSKENAKS